jgi:hypothetical protein
VSCSEAEPGGVQRPNKPSWWLPEPPVHKWNPVEGDSGNRDRPRVVLRHIKLRILPDAEASRGTAVDCGTVSPTRTSPKRAAELAAHGSCQGHVVGGNKGVGAAEPVRANRTGEAPYLEVGRGGDLAGGRGWQRWKRSCRPAKRSRGWKAPRARSNAAAFASGSGRRPFKASRVPSGTR